MYVVCNVYNIFSINKSEKDSDMSKRNHEFNTCSTLNFRNADIWSMHYNKHEQSEKNHWKTDKK